jgi:hypothetical protein
MRAARALALLATIASCNPAAFDELVGDDDRRDAGGTSSDAGGDGGSQDAGATDAGDREPIADGGDAATSDSGAPEVDSGSDAAAPSCPSTADPDTVQVRAAELGAITIPSVQQPLAGPSVRLGDRILWTFTAESSTLATWSTPEERLSSPPDLQVPEPVIPLLPAGSLGAGLAASLGGAVALNDREALVYFAAYNFFVTGEVGLARIALDARQATLVHAAGELFPLAEPPEPGAEPRWFPRFYTGAFRYAEPDGVYAYVYSCNADPSSPDEQTGGANALPCRLARVSIDHAHDGTAYRYWDGSGWMSDAARSRVVINQVPGELTVSYNRYLEKFLAVHNVPGVNQIALRWADRPEGPWRLLGQLDTAPATGAYGFTIGAREQPALRDPCDRTLYLTYALPLTTTGADGMPLQVFEARLVRVELGPD